MPPVVFTTPQIRDYASELAVGGEPFLPELLIARELLGLLRVPDLKQVGQYRAERDLNYRGQARDDAIHLISRTYLQPEFTPDL